MNPEEKRKKSNLGTKKRERERERERERKKERQPERRTFLDQKNLQQGKMLGQLSN